MYDVFISYKSEEEDKAQEVFDKLEANGISCWMDHSGGLIGGDTYATKIFKAISKVKIFVIILSNSCLESEPIKKEVQYAANALFNENSRMPLRTIIPFQIEKDVIIDPERHEDFLLLETYQKIFGDGDKFSNALDKLVVSVREILGDGNSQGKPVLNQQSKEDNEDGEARKKSEEDEKLLKRIKSGERVDLELSQGVRSFNCDEFFYSSLWESKKNRYELLGIGKCGAPEDKSEEDLCVLEISRDLIRNSQNVFGSRTLRLSSARDLYLASNDFFGKPFFKEGIVLNNHKVTMEDVVQCAKALPDGDNVFKYEQEKMTFPNLKNMPWPAPIMNKYIKIEDSGYAQFENACREFLDINTYLINDARHMCDTFYESSDFEEYDRLCDTSGIPSLKFNVAIIHMTIPFLRDPKEFLRRVKSELAENGKIIIIDYDIGITQIAPDESGVFNEAKSIYTSVNAFGSAYSGREIRKYLRQVGFQNITLEHAGSFSLKMDYENKRQAFIDFYNILSSKFSCLLKKFPNEVDFANKLTWYEEHHDQLESEFLEEDSVYLPGYMIWTATVNS